MKIEVIVKGVSYTIRIESFNHNLKVWFENLVIVEVQGTISDAIDAAKSFFLNNRIIID
ncbi:MAG TPA: hypothetical protein VMR41_01610 [Patescibacteria group bacterium]|jgi:hypothetical protein|nr:hypothetical protein [Patescibacteria group bacterium]